MTWVEPATWYARLATFHAAAALFVTDDTGRVLLVVDRASPAGPRPRALVTC